MNDFAAFARLVEAIEEWRGCLVIVGGWAHRLHRFHPMANVPDYDPLVTKDTDLAFGNRMPLEGDIKKALLEHDFQEVLTGDHRPPVAKYTLGADDQGFYAEFLTPQTGSGRRRDGPEDATVSAAGITAQKLRYLEVLLIEAWIINVGAAQGIPLSPPRGIQVANPAAFIAQKLLIHEYRLDRKRPQDILYIHDTLELFSERLGDLKAIWNKSIRPQLHPNTAGKVAQVREEVFSSVTDDIRDAALVAPERQLSPGRIQAMCSYLLTDLFR